MNLIDDLGRSVRWAGPPARVVSLVPSLTEAIAVSRAGLLVGATDWCTHPGDLDVTRVRGTKNPAVDVIVGLRPDLVVANQEENREVDVAALVAAGVPVWVTAPTTVPEALDSLGRLLSVACGLGDEPGWLGAARTAWATPSSARCSAVIPIWRRPWMVVGHGTFTGDLLARLGVTNVFDDSPDRYPRVSLDEVSARRPDVVVLPDEPYAFSVDDGPEAFEGVPCVLVEGRLLTWYGPSLVTARAELEEALRAWPAATT